MQKKKKNPTKKKAENGRKWRPSAKMIAMAEMLVNPDDKRSKDAKMKSIGLPERTFYNWMQDERFVSYVNSLIDKYTNAALPEVWRALLRKCTMFADVPAIRLYFEMKGMYSENKKIELTGKDGGPIQTETAVTFYIPDNGRGDNSA